MYNLSHLPNTVEREVKIILYTWKYSPRFYFCPFRPRGQMQKYKKVDFLSHLVAVKFMAWSDALVNKLILNKKKNIVILTS